jgi:hypothetical protein
LQRCAHSHHQSASFTGAAFRRFRVNPDVPDRRRFTPPRCARGEIGTTEPTSRCCAVFIHIPQTITHTSITHPSPRVQRRLFRFTHRHAFRSQSTYRWRRKEASQRVYEPCICLGWTAIIHQAKLGVVLRVVAAAPQHHLNTVSIGVDPIPP